MYWTDERTLTGKRMLLICGFGTGDADEMKRTYGRLAEEAREAYPLESVRLALTSAKVIERLYRESGIRLPDVRSALEDAAAAGAGEIRILTVLVAGGREYEKLKAIADACSRPVRISPDSPLLAGSGTERMADILIEEAACFQEEAIVYVGHGTHGRDQFGPAAYRKLRDTIRSRGNGNIFIGELQTGVEPVVKALSEKSFRRVRLCSLMMVSGYHWTVDVAGEKNDSWKHMLSEAGYEVTCDRTGLLERKAVREILIAM